MITLSDLEKYDPSGMHKIYDQWPEIAKKAYREGTTLKEAAIASGLVTAEQFDIWIRPEDMVNNK